MLSFPIEDEARAQRPLARRGRDRPRDRSSRIPTGSSCSATWSSARRWRPRNAVDHGVTFDDEIALLVVHGILHLLGMDHEIEAEAERMEQREQQLLARFYRVGFVTGRSRP